MIVFAQEDPAHIRHVSPHQDPPPHSLAEPIPFESEIFKGVLYIRMRRNAPEVLQSYARTRVCVV